MIERGSNSSSVASLHKENCLPRRISLIDETVLVLKRSISRGILIGTLPGELQLKARLGVSRDTLRRALELLTKEGWIFPSSRGRQRQVRIGHSSYPTIKCDRKFSVTFVSPHSHWEHITCLKMKEIRQQLFERGLHIKFVAPKIFHLKQPQRYLEQLVNEHPSAAWILHLTSEPIQRWFAKQGLPTLLYEPAFGGVELPYLAADWEAAAFHSGIKLIKYGHRRIGILESHQCDSGLLAAELGLKRALETVKAVEQMNVLYEHHSPTSVAAALERAFRSKQPPTALVITRPAQLLTCYSWFASRGMQIPRDVSIISLVKDSWYAKLYPKVCHYQTNAEVISNEIEWRIIALTEKSFFPITSLYVPMNYVAGSTVGAARPDCSMTNLNPSRH